MADVSYSIKLIDLASSVAKTIEKNFNRIQGSVDRISSSFSTFNGVIAGVGVGAVLKMGAELEKTQLQFEVLTGSAEKGAKVFDGLTKFANETPLTNEGINKNASLLMAFGESAESVVGTLKMLGDVAMGDQDRLNGLSLAFAQIMARGKLQGQELNQLVERGFNPLKNMADRTGVSYKDLTKKMEKGQITFEMVKKEFELATGEGGKFHDMMVRMGQTMAGKWSTVVGKGQYAIGKFVLKFKELFLPILDRAIGYIDRFLIWMEENSEQIKEWGRAVMTVIPYVGAFIVSMKILNAVLATNPIALVITALAGLAVYLTHLYNTSYQARKQMDGLWEAMKEIGNIALEFLQPVIDQFFELKKMVGDVFGIFSNGSVSDGFLSDVIKGVEAIITGVRIVQKMMFGFNEGILKMLTLDFEGGMESFKRNAQEIGDLLSGSMIGSTDKLLARISGAYKKGASAKGIYGGAMGAAQMNMLALAEKKKSMTAGLKGTGGLLSTDGLTSGLAGAEAEKLKAEGVVSGNINTFNINISTLNGIAELHTTNMNGTADQVGNGMRDALVRALADIKVM